MMLIRPFLPHTRASVSVEFALVSVFFLLPLLAGAADLVLLIAGQAQMNTAQQALYYFAISNAGNATSSTYAQDVLNVINSANSASGVTVSMPSTTTVPIHLGTTTVASGQNNPFTYYGCFNSSSTTVTYQSTTCSSGFTQQTYAVYEVQGTVQLPFPIPGNGTAITLTASGGIQTAIASN